MAPDRTGRCGGKLPEAAATRRQLILDIVADLAGDFLNHDRKEDHELPRGEIEKAVAAGEVTVDEIVDAFSVVLARWLT